jgi:hypothetical protein
MSKDSSILRITIPPENDDIILYPTQKTLKRDIPLSGCIRFFQSVLITSIVSLILWIYIKFAMWTIS